MEIVNKLTNDTNIKESQAFKDLILSLAQQNKFQAAALQGDEAFLDFQHIRDENTFDQVDQSIFDIDQDQDFDLDDLRRLYDLFDEDSFVKGGAEPDNTVDNYYFKFVDGYTGTRRGAGMNRLLNNMKFNQSQFMTAQEILENLFVLSAGELREEIEGNLAYVSDKVESMDRTARFLDAFDYSMGQGFAPSETDRSTYYNTDYNPYQTDIYNNGRDLSQAEYYIEQYPVEVQLDHMATRSYGNGRRLNVSIYTNYETFGKDFYQKFGLFKASGNSNDPEFMEFYTTAVELTKLLSENNNDIQDPMLQMQADAMKAKLTSLSDYEIPQGSRTNYIYNDVRGLAKTGSDLEQAETLAIASLLGLDGVQEFSFNSKEEELVFSSYFKDGLFGEKALQEIGDDKQALAKLQARLTVLAQGGSLGDLAADIIEESFGTVTFSGEEEQERFQVLMNFNPYEALLFSPDAETQEMKLLAAGASLDLVESHKDIHAAVAKLQSFAVGNEDLNAADYLITALPELDGVMDAAVENRSFDEAELELQKFEQLIKLANTFAGSEEVANFKAILEFDPNAVEGEHADNLVQYATGLKGSILEQLERQNYLNPQTKLELSSWSRGEEMATLGFSAASIRQVHNLMEIDTEDIHYDLVKAFWNELVADNKLESLIDPDNETSLEDREKEINILDAQRRLVEMAYSSLEGATASRIPMVARSLANVMNYEVEANVSDQDVQVWYNDSLEQLKMDLALDIENRTISSEINTRLMVFDQLLPAAMEAGASVATVSNINQFYMKANSFDASNPDDMKARGVVFPVMIATTQAIRNGEVNDEDLFAVGAEMATILSNDSSVVNEDYIHNTLRNISNLQNSVKQIDTEYGNSAELREHIYNELNRVKSFARGSSTVNDLMLSNLNSITDKNADNYVSNLELHDSLLDVRRSIINGDYDLQHDLNRDGVVNDDDVSVMDTFNVGSLGYGALKDLANALNPEFRVAELNTQEKIYYVGLIDSLVQHSDYLQELSGDEYTVHERAVEQKKAMLRALSQGMSFDGAVVEAIATDLGLDELNFSSQATSDIFFEKYGFNFNPNARSAAELSAYQHSMLSDADFEILDEQLRVLAAGGTMRDYRNVEYAYELGFDHIQISDDASDEAEAFDRLFDSYQYYSAVELGVEVVEPVDLFILPETVTGSDKTTLLHDALQSLAAGAKAEGIDTVIRFKAKEIQYRSQEQKTREISQIKPFVENGDLETVSSYLKIADERDFIASVGIKDLSQMMNGRMVALVSRMMTSVEDGSTQWRKIEAENTKILQSRLNRMSRQAKGGSLRDYQRKELAAIKALLGHDLSVAEESLLYGKKSNNTLKAIHNNLSGRSVQNKPLISEEQAKDLNQILVDPNKLKAILGIADSASSRTFAQVIRYELEPILNMHQFGTSADPVRTIKRIENRVRSKIGAQRRMMPKYKTQQLRNLALMRIVAWKMSVGIPLTAQEQAIVGEDTYEKWSSLSF